MEKRNLGKTSEGGEGFSHKIPDISIPEKQNSDLSTTKDRQDEVMIEEIREQLSQSPERKTSKVEEVDIKLPEEFANRNLHYYKSGEDGKPKVVLIHGWGQSGKTFLPLIEEMSDYQVFSVDLPGFGDSEPLRSKRHQLDRYVDAISWFIEQIGDEGRVYGVLGHSLGGIIAGKMIERDNTKEKIAEKYGVKKRPPIFERVIFSGLPAEGIKDGEALNNSILEKLMKLFLKTRKRLPENLRVKLEKRQQLEGDIIDPELIDSEYIAAFKKADDQSAVDTAKHMSKYRFRQTQIPNDIKVIYLHGEKDRYTAPGTILTTASDKGGVAKIFPDSGHDVYLDSKEDFNREVIDFLQ